MLRNEQHVPHRPRPLLPPGQRLADVDVACCYVSWAQYYSNAPQGVLQCWVDIMPPGDAKGFEPDDVALPPEAEFEVRVFFVLRCVTRHTRAERALSVPARAHNTIMASWLQLCPTDTGELACDRGFQYA